MLTLRNGREGDERYPKSYAEKLLLNPEGQRAPAHFHRSKREDIICVAGGNMLVLFKPVDDAGGAMTVRVDGVPRDVRPNGLVRLEPAESVTIPPRTIHQFWGEEGTGLDVDGVGHTVSREVSSVCDDRNDNVFADGAGVRFPPIAEDEPREVYLCHEYPPRRR